MKDEGEQSYLDDSWHLSKNLMLPRLPNRRRAGRVERVVMVKGKTDDMRLNAQFRMGIVQVNGPSPFEAINFFRIERNRCIHCEEDLERIYLSLNCIHLFEEFKGKYSENYKLKWLRTSVMGFYLTFAPCGRVKTEQQQLQQQQHIKGEMATWIRSLPSQGSTMTLSWQHTMVAGDAHQPAV
ncbi:hypothetical protein PV326_003306 [Microctonus aethiopoides]|nr:hypothetical protein PV326_003306 [Microctonus aethiopoides]